MSRWSSSACSRCSRAASLNRSSRTCRSRPGRGPRCPRNPERRPAVLARFFIDRPVLAWVISLVIVLLGAISAGFLPIAEYPEIQPPTVRGTANYPGANAQVVADTVAAPIQQQVGGRERT